MPLPKVTEDRTPLPDVQTRYAIGRTALNARIRHCGIVPYRSGNRAFLNPEQVEILDELHDHLGAGRGMSDFASPIAEVVEDENERTAERSAIVPDHRPRAPMRIDLAPIQTEAGPTRIETLRTTLQFLTDCEAEGWLLPTSEIHELLGASPRRSGWTRYGFVFEAAGTHGKETAWAISRPSA